MSRGYPRFLFSDPANIKDQGPFIIHTLAPRFILKPRFDGRRDIIDWKILEVWSEGYDNYSVHKVACEVPEWFKRSGIQQSSNDDDKLITAVQSLTFLKDVAEHYTVDQAKLLIQLLFPTQTKGIYEGSSSYGLKHFFEHISRTIIGDRMTRSKYCSNDTVIQAFEELKYKWKQDGPNRYFNISARDINKAKRLFWNY
jgi:hypothetical protein